MKCPNCNGDMVACYCDEHCCGAMLLEFECRNCELFHWLGYDGCYDEADYPVKEIGMEDVTFWKDLDHEG